MGSPNQMMSGMPVATISGVQRSEQIDASEQADTASFAIKSGQISTSESSGTYCPPVRGIFITSSAQRRKGTKRLEKFRNIRV